MGTMSVTTRWPVTQEAGWFFPELACVPESGPLETGGGAHEQRAHSDGGVCGQWALSWGSSSSRSLAGHCQGAVPWGLGSASCWSPGPQRRARTRGTCPPVLSSLAAPRPRLGQSPGCSQEAACGVTKSVTRGTGPVTVQRVCPRPELTQLGDWAAHPGARPRLLRGPQALTHPCDPEPQTHGVWPGPEPALCALDRCPLGIVTLLLAARRAAGMPRGKWPVFLFARIP